MSGILNVLPGIVGSGSAPYPPMSLAVNPTSDLGENGGDINHTFSPSSTLTIYGGLGPFAISREFDFIDDGGLGTVWSAEPNTGYSANVSVSGMIDIEMYYSANLKTTVIDYGATPPNVMSINVIYRYRRSF